jgi:rSAM/selenodomain-associated transferase 2
VIATDAPRLSVIVPVLNDAAALACLLDELNPGARPALEVLVMDGGSSDQPERHTDRPGVRLIACDRGRGQQLAAGAAAARGRWLWFVHADTAAIDAALEHVLALPADVQPDDALGWGRFDVRFDQASPPWGAVLAMVAFLMRLRSRLTGICTGDQGIFVHRDILERAGGVPPQPLMEDIELSRRLKRLGRPQARRETITTSARRWHQRGVLRTVVGMWWYRLRYWLGADPGALARSYYR